MNAKTIILNVAIGVACGFLTLLTFKQPTFCCCGTPLLLIVGAMVGSGLASLVHGVSLPTGPVLGIGALHGILVAVGAIAAIWLGLFHLTSDETIRSVLSSYEQQLADFQRQAEEAAKNQPEEDRQAIRESREELEKVLREAKEDPPAMRRFALSMAAFTAGVLCTLSGLLGGLLGRTVFRGRLKPAGAEPNLDGDRMQIPDQTDRWWEKEK
jgi:hypothetical protein